MILLDTNVISELMKDKPDQAVARWYRRHEEKTFLPAIALAELSFGIARLAAGAKKRKLEERLTEIRVRYAARMPGFGPHAALRYGPMLAGVVAAGRAMSLPDAQIAAMALTEGASVATRDRRDFEPSGCELVDPWDG